MTDYVQWRISVIEQRNVQDAAIFCAAILSDAAPNDYLKESVAQSAHYFQWKRK